MNKICSYLFACIDKPQISCRGEQVTDKNLVQTEATSSPDRLQQENMHELQMHMQICKSAIVYGLDTGLVRNLHVFPAEHVINSWTQAS